MIMEYPKKLGYLIRWGVGTSHQAGASHSGMFLQRPAIALVRTPGCQLGPPLRPTPSPCPPFQPHSGPFGQAARPAIRAHLHRGVRTAGAAAGVTWATIVAAAAGYMAPPRLPERIASQITQITHRSYLRRDDTKGTKKCLLIVTWPRCLPPCRRPGRPHPQYWRPHQLPAPNLAPRLRWCPALPSCWSCR